MDEREAEERAGPAPLPEQVEPTEDAVPSMVDSTRASGESEARPPVDAEAVEQRPEPGPVPTDMPENLLAADASLVALEVEGESEAVEPGAEDGAAAAAGPERDEPAAESLEPLETTTPAAPTPTAAQEHRAAAAEGLRRGRLPQGAVPVEGREEPAWYVIHCYSGYENKVRHNLEQRIETMGMKDRIFDVVIPTQEEIEVKEGKRRTVERHIFPGYVLVNMTLSEESWYVVRNTPGVTGFVGMGNLPTPLRPEEVSQIIKRMESEAPAVKVSFKVGERVRIIDGPFNDFRGTVADIDMERTKVRMMVSFFGRETPVELDFLQVEKA
jgi:transcriptional antiterminator NusG